MSRRDEIYARKRAEFLASRGTPPLDGGGMPGDSYGPGDGSYGGGNPGAALEAAWNASRARDPPAPYVREAHKVVDDGPIRVGEVGTRNPQGTGYRVTREPGGGSSLSLQWNDDRTKLDAPQPKGWNPITGTPRDDNRPTAAQQVTYQQQEQPQYQQRDPYQGDPRGPPSQRPSQEQYQQPPPQQQYPPAQQPGSYRGAPPQQSGRDHPSQSVSQQMQRASQELDSWEMERQSSRSNLAAGGAPPGGDRMSGPPGGGGQPMSLREEGGGPPAAASGRAAPPSLDLLQLQTGSTQGQQRVLERERFEREQNPYNNGGMISHNQPKVYVDNSMSTAGRLRGADNKQQHRQEQRYPTTSNDMFTGAGPSDYRSMRQISPQKKGDSGPLWPGGSGTPTASGRPQQLTPNGAQPERNYPVPSSNSNVFPGMNDNGPPSLHSRRRRSRDQEITGKIGGSFPPTPTGSAPPAHGGMSQQQSYGGGGLHGGGPKPSYTNNVYAPPAMPTRTSSNAFATGSNQNAGNFITDRPTTLVAKPPGGGSTLVLG